MAAENKKILISIEVKGTGAEAVSKSTQKATQDLSKLTQAEIKQRIEAEKLKITNAELSASFKEQAAAQLLVANEGKPFRAQAGLNNAILLETSRLASDAGYGFTAIANNLSQVISLFFSFSKTAGGVVNSLKELGRSIIGTGGVLIAVQLLIAFGDDIYAFFTRLIKGADETAGAFDDLSKRVASSAGDFEIYIKTLQSSTKSDKEKKDAIVALQREFPEYIQLLNESGVSLEDVANKTAEAKKQNDLYRESIVNLAKSEAAREKIRELQGQLIEIQIERETEAQDRFGKSTEDLSKEIENYNNSLSTNLALTGTSVNTLQDFYKAEKEVLAIRKDEEDLIQRQINILLGYVDIVNKETKDKGRSAKASKEKNKYDMLEIENYDKLIRLIREAGQMREFFFNKEMDIILNREENSQKAIEMERQGVLARVDALVDLGLLEENAAVTRYQINQYYNKLAAEDQRKLDEEGFAMRMEMISSYASALGSVSEIIGQNTAAGKAAALAEIAINTAVGYSQGLVVAQEQSLSAPPVSSLAFPLFYAQQIAAVLAAAAQAKNILKGGSPSGAKRGASKPSVQVEAPDFNVVGASPESQLAQSVAEQQAKPIKAFVVGKDVTTQQELDRNIRTTAGLGG